MVRRGSLERRGPVYGLTAVVLGEVVGVEEEQGPAHLLLYEEALLGAGTPRYHCTSLFRKRVEEHAPPAVELVLSQPSLRAQLLRAVRETNRHSLTTAVANGGPGAACLRTGRQLPLTVRCSPAPPGGPRVPGDVTGRSRGTEAGAVCVRTGSRAPTCQIVIPSRRSAPATSHMAGPAPYTYTPSTGDRYPAFYAGPVVIDTELDGDPRPASPATTPTKPTTGKDSDTVMSRIITNRFKWQATPSSDPYYYYSRQVEVAKYYVSGWFNVPLVSVVTSSASHRKLHRQQDLQRPPLSVLTSKVKGNNGPHELFPVSALLHLDAASQSSGRHKKRTQNYHQNQCQNPSKKKKEKTVSPRARRDDKDKQKQKQKEDEMEAVESRVKSLKSFSSGFGGSFAGFCG
ncbi:hypothetical protein FIBSPDRAFT_904303 [Athelia psychrophila]|uniref:Uncharacterized protein n=1 Tax=Athelia psychrophila TaxID=1759441 RepID=A0A167UXE6_9AGAM|nr:hypothetical protein FIBSPDRAFT_904303 [Fibularhizoctonia sp. CBS 109695]